MNGINYVSPRSWLSTSHFCLVPAMSIPPVASNVLGIIVYFGLYIHNTGPRCILHSSLTPWAYSPPVLRIYLARGSLGVCFPERKLVFLSSTPVLKIALPSSPLPEHRQLSRPSTRRLAPFRALSSELGSKTKAQFPEPFSVLTSTRNL